ncbi:ComEA family DNA-binding protein [Nitrosomonas mobilis]|uniref:Putative DNA transport competence protein, ComEA n=1 Tax=Nitrosomonas mobilis TaxID=51642 RepID=A0A1G5SAJ0_9PROT
MKQFFLVFLVIFCFSNPVFSAVDINTATQSELETLKGIGPAKAKAIIEYRNQVGQFKSVNELTRVKGIGTNTVQKLSDQIVVSDTIEQAEVLK